MNQDQRDYITLGCIVLICIALLLFSWAGCYFWIAKVNPIHIQVPRDGN